MTDINQRVAAVEVRVEGAFAIDSRLKTLESDVRKLKGGSTLRDWIQTLGPYASGLIVLVVGFWIKDSVTLALQREQLDLEYVKQMRDLVKDFDEASTQPVANANATGLAMYGKHAIMPLVERLESGDVAPIAAERGLRLIGANDPVVACPKFLSVVKDRSRRFTWQTHKTMIGVLSQSGCTKTLVDLQNYRDQLVALGKDNQKIATFAKRYSNADAFDAESAGSLRAALDESIEILAEGQP